MANEVCLRTLHLDRPWLLSTYESEGGYEALRKILKEKHPRKTLSKPSRPPDCAVAAARASPRA